MTQEEIQLLLVDLSARLTYGVKCLVTKSRTEEGQRGDVGKIVCVCLEGVDCIDTSFFSEFGNFKPYLFPLSSMTEEQRKEFLNIQSEERKILFDALVKYRYEKEDKIPIIPSQKHIDWFNANYFDYRGLIEKGLAIDATNKNIY